MTIEHEFQFSIGDADETFRRYIETAKSLFQFSIGDAEEGHVEVSKLLLERVSILYWRCDVLDILKRALPRYDGFNSLLEMHAAGYGAVSPAAEEAGFNSLLEMRIVTVL